MNRRNVFILLIVIAALLSVLSRALSAVAVQYTWVIQPLTLFAGFLIAQKVAGIYPRDLKKSFFFLSLFLLLYMPANIPLQVLWIPLRDAVGPTGLLIITNILQAAAYAMLITSCVYTLKVIEIKRINLAGWTVMGILLLLCAYIIYQGIPAIQNQSLVNAISLMVIRVFDMAIILMLVPVLLLRLQYSRSKSQESLTFTMIMGGVIVSLLSTYLFELAGVSVSDIVQSGSWLDVIYIFGYLLIAGGLYANMKYDEWGYRDIERALG